MFQVCSFTGRDPLTLGVVEKETEKQIQWGMTQ